MERLMELKSTIMIKKISIGLVTAALLLTSASASDRKSFSLNTEKKINKISDDVAIYPLDEIIIAKQKQIILGDQRFKLKLNDVEIISKEILANGWTLYQLNLKIEKDGRELNSPYVVFTDGTYLTNSMTDIRDLQRLEQKAYKKIQENLKTTEQKERDFFQKEFVLDTRYYDAKHLMSGDIKAKNKIVIISDPLCIACIRTIPSILRDVKGRDDVAVFHYHFPLKDLHPTAYIISKAMEQAKKDGIKDIEEKVYSLNFDNIYEEKAGKKAEEKARKQGVRESKTIDNLKNQAKAAHNVYKEKDEAFALEMFNEEFKTSYTVSSLNSIDLDNAIVEDMKIGNLVRLQGTPTILFNGSLSQSRQKLQKFLQEK